MPKEEPAEVQIARMRQRTQIVTIVLILVALVAPLAVDAQGQRQPVIVAVVQAFSGQSNTEPTTVVQQVTATLLPATASSVSTEEVTQEATAIILYSCPELIEVPASGPSQRVEIDIPQGEIAFIDAREVDVVVGEPIFLTIIGPYQNTIEIEDGNVCYGIPADVDYSVLEQIRRSRFPEFSYFEEVLP